MRRSLQPGSIVLAVGPGSVLGLGVCGSDVGEPRVGVPARHCPTEQLLNAGNGLAGPTMSDRYGPALVRFEQAPELWAALQDCLAGLGLGLRGPALPARRCCARSSRRAAGLPFRY